MKQTDLFMFFWIGETAEAIRAAGPSTMLLASFLNSDSRTNDIGFFHFDADRAATYTGLTTSEVQVDMQTLQEIGFLKYDLPTSMVWITDRVDYAIGRIRANDKVRIELANAEFAAIPSACEMRWEFFDAYEFMLHLRCPDDEVQNASADAPIVSPPPPAPVPKQTPAAG